MCKMGQSYLAEGTKLHVGGMAGGGGGCLCINDVTDLRNDILTTNFMG